MNTDLRLNGITKEYKSFKLDNITLELPKGMSTALIGTNGAGKTTLLDIIAGISLKYTGTAEYFGGKTISDPQVRSLIGYTAAGNYFSPDWKQKNIESVLGAAFDNFHTDRFREWLNRFSIEFGKKKISALSDGNIMRVMLASVLARDTKMLVLDEPASPLDPVMRDRLCDIFREYTSDGEKSVLFSTHNIADMENVTDYAVIMADGKIIEQGYADDLREKYILVHGDGKDMARYKPYMVDCSGGANGFEGIAPEANRHHFENGDVIIESPHLQQICVALLKNAEKKD